MARLPIVLLLLALASPAIAEPRLRLLEEPAPRAHLVDPLRLDDGGGAPAVDGRTREVLSYLLAFFVGFGTGHLLMGDDDDFVFFLVVDAVLVVLAGGGPFVLKPLAYVAGVALLASHVWQVLDLVGMDPAKMVELRGGAPAWANALDLRF